MDLDNPNVEKVINVCHNNETVHALEVSNTFSVNMIQSTQKTQKCDQTKGNIHEGKEKPKTGSNECGRCRYYHVDRTSVAKGQT